MLGSVDTDTPCRDAQVLTEVDAVDHRSHSEKGQAAPTYKGFGFHPLWSFVDHGTAGTGQPLSVLLRPGNAGSNTVTDHIAVIKAALAQLPDHLRGRRAGPKVLIRIDGAGCTHKVLTWMSGHRLSYSVGFPIAPQHVRPVGADPSRRVDPGLRRPRSAPRRRGSPS
jgi:hypothetical protein